MSCVVASVVLYTLPLYNEVFAVELLRMHAQYEMQ
jgi:hypothetical protein